MTNFKRLFLCFAVCALITPAAAEDKKPVESRPVTAPTLITPENGKKFTLQELQRPVMFRWTPLVPKPKEPVTYRVKVWQLMQGQNGIQAMKANQPIITKDVDNLTQTTILNLTTGPCMPPYLCDFIWNVQALNRKGKPIGGNNGMSEASVFSITNEEQVKNGPEKRIYLISPEDQTILKTSRPTFEWKMESILEGVTYSITVRELEEGKDIESGKILFERSDIRENVFRYPAGVPPLDTSKAYSWEISAYDKNKVLIGKANPKGVGRRQRH